MLGEGNNLLALCTAITNIFVMRGSKYAHPNLNSVNLPGD